MSITALFLSKWVPPESRIEPDRTAKIEPWSLQEFYSGRSIRFYSDFRVPPNDYQSRISSEIVNLNEALENSCRILLEQSTKYIIKLAGPTSIINNRTTSH